MVIVDNKYSEVKDDIDNEASDELEKEVMVFLTKEKEEATILT